MHQIIHLFHFCASATVPSALAFMHCLPGKVGCLSTRSGFPEPGKSYLKGDLGGARRPEWGQEKLAPSPRCATFCVSFRQVPSCRDSRSSGVKKPTAVLGLASPWDGRVTLCWCSDLPEHKGEPRLKKNTNQQTNKQTKKPPKTRRVEVYFRRAIPESQSG